jgi:hypothetical protein
MNETTMTANDFGAVVCAAFIVAGLTPMPLPMMIASSKSLLFRLRSIGVWMRRARNLLTIPDKLNSFRAYMRSCRQNSNNE